MERHELIKILFVEDLMDDVIISEEVLKRDGILFESRTAMSLEALGKELQSFKPMQ